MNHNIIKYAKFWKGSHSTNVFESVNRIGYFSSRDEFLPSNDAFYESKKQVVFLSPMVMNCTRNFGILVESEPRACSR